MAQTPVVPAGTEENRKIRLRTARFSLAKRGVPLPGQAGDRFPFRLARDPGLGDGQRGGHLHVRRQPAVDFEGVGSRGRIPPIWPREGRDGGDAVPGDGHRPDRGRSDLGGGAAPVEGAGADRPGAGRGHPGDGLFRPVVLVRLRPDPEGGRGHGLHRPVRPIRSISAPTSIPGAASSSRCSCSALPGGSGWTRGSVWW